jgi:hypothetical protein
MSSIHEVWEIGRLAGSPRYKSVRVWTAVGDPPFSSCDHLNETREEAAKCRVFGRGAVSHPDASGGG